MGYWQFRAQVARSGQEWPANERERDHPRTSTLPCRDSNSCLVQSQINQCTDSALLFFALIPQREIKLWIATTTAYSRCSFWPGTFSHRILMTNNEFGDCRSAHIVHLYLCRFTIFTWIVRLRSWKRIISRAGIKDYALNTLHVRREFRLIVSLMKKSDVLITNGAIYNSSELGMYFSIGKCELKPELICINNVI